MHINLVRSVRLGCASARVCWWQRMARTRAPCVPFAAAQRVWPLTPPPSQHSHTLSLLSPLSPCGYVWARRLDSSARLKVDPLHGVFFAYTGSRHAHRVQMWLCAALFCCVYDTFVKHKAPLCVWKAIHCVEIKHTNPWCVLYSVSSMCDCSFGLQWSCQPPAPDHATLAQIRQTNRWSHHTTGSRATASVCAAGNSFLSRLSALPPHNL